MKNYRVLLHIDELAKSDLVLGNARNLLLDLGKEQVETEILINHEAVYLCIRTPNRWADQIMELSKKGVRFAVCSNAMRAFGVTKDLLLDTIEPVSSGMGEITQKQKEGFLYIQP